MKTAMRTVEINGLRVGAGLTHLIIAGPCVIEDTGLVLETAAELKRITTDLKLSTRPIGAPAPPFAGRG